MRGGGRGSLARLCGERGDGGIAANRCSSKQEKADPPPPHVDEVLHRATPSVSRMRGPRLRRMLPLQGPKGKGRKWHASCEGPFKTLFLPRVVTWRWRLTFVNLINMPNIRFSLYRSSLVTWEPGSTPPQYGHSQGRGRAQVRLQRALFANARLGLEQHEAQRRPVPRQSQHRVHQWLAGDGRLRRPYRRESLFAGRSHPAVHLAQPALRRTADPDQGRRALAKDRRPAFSSIATRVRARKPCGRTRWSAPPRNKRLGPIAWAEAPGYEHAAAARKRQRPARDSGSASSGASAAGAWVGLAHAALCGGTSAKRGPITIDWQTDGKHYQYWTRADAAGRFTIRNARPGVYTLYAFTDGVLGDFSRADGSRRSGQDDGTWAR